MSFFKNKHLLTAAIVAPLLALTSYFAIDALVGESPHAAVTGHTYKLIAKPDCRRRGGHCGLKNGEFELNLSIEWQQGDQGKLMLESAFPLDGIKIALETGQSDEEKPFDMVRNDEDGLLWTLETKLPAAEDQLRLVASADGTLYFGDTAAIFMLADEAP